jgi:hypothetical protein
MTVDEPKDTKKEHGKITEKQCPQCTQWIDVRGYNSHNRFCDANNEENTSKDNENQPKTLDITPDEIACPNCTNTDNIHDAKGVSNIYSQQGHTEQANELKQYDKYCLDCHTAFNEDEIA